MIWLFLARYYAAGFVVPIAIFIAGFVVAMKLQRRSKLTLGLSTLLIPPMALIATYYAASSTGCSGGDCTGPMLALGLLAIPLAAVSLFGLGVLIQAAVSYAGAFVR